MYWWKTKNINMALPNMAMIPSGYKPTKLYSVLPTPENGSEEVTNGDFATDSDWIKLSGVTISGGMANAPFSSSGNIIRQSSTVLDINKTYRYEFTILNYVSGNIKFAGFIGSANESGNGTYVGYAKPSDINNMVLFGSFEGSIDNVSVKEVIVADADFTVTRATPATRVNQQGLIETPEFILSGDLITNGDFSDGSTDWTSIGSGITITDKANFDGSVASTNFRQNGIVLSTKTLKVTYTVNDYAQGSLAVRVGGVYGVNRTADGTYTDVITANNNNFQIYGLSNFIGSIDNVSAVEVERNNIPRLDYTDGTCPVLLTEPQSTNLQTYSEDLTNAAWNKDAVTLGTATVAPDGETTAYPVIATATTDWHYLNGTNFGAGTGHTITVFVKSFGYDYIHVFNNNAAFSFYVQISTKTVVSKNAAYWGDVTVTDAANGFIKITGVFIGVEATNRISVRGVPTAGTTSPFLGNGASGIYVWGCQFENLPYATSYIPTNGSAVTRNQDIVNNAGTSATYNSVEGVLFVDVAVLVNQVVNKRITISDGTDANRILINISADQISGFVNVNSATQYTFFEGSQSVLNLNKIAIKYKQNDFAVWINGVQYDVSTSGTTFPSNTLTTLSFDNGSSGEFFFGKTSQVQVFNTALSDFDLQNLTSNATAYATYETMRTSLNFNIQ